ncbi:MAG: hypothetical protein PW843_10255 [Azospirillaceae bacterium]|nr:hypothetical protein [Azospirillaceae bacterium]
MSYTLRLAANVLKIAEKEWGKAGEIKFTLFTSCIGIVAKKAGSNEVIGVHLVMTDDQHEFFTDGDADDVKRQFDTYGADASTIEFIGEIGTWESSRPNPYKRLVALIKPVAKKDLGEGTYGAKLTNGKVVIVTY